MRSHYLKFILFALTICLIFSVQTPSYAQYPGFNDPGARQVGGGAGGLVPVEVSVDGGVIPIGATSQVVIRFRNDGSQPVQTGLIRLYPSSTISGEVALNQCQDEPLPAGAECAIAVSIKGLQSGQWRAEMLMTHSGRTRLVAATLSGVVESAGDGSDELTSDIQASPEEVDFGTLQATQTLFEPVVLRNITSNSIEIKNIYVDTTEQAGYSLKTECKSLKAGQSCLALINWSPQLEGRSSGVLVVEHTGPAGLTSVPLEGEYNPQGVEEAELFPRAVPGKGLLVASQTEIEFGEDVETASTITVSLVNSGDADLTIKGIEIPGSDNGLSFKSDGCSEGTILKPIEACPLTITWSPTRVGQLFDDVQIVHDGARGVLVLPIRGAALSTVSQDQRAIVLSGQGGGFSSGDGAGLSQRDRARAQNSGRVMSSGSYGQGAINPAAALDGYKITSFSSDRAIINGPGGSRIVFDNEETVIGGVPWFVLIQKNGIEFLHQGKRVLLLFDRSLSSINRVSASASNNRTTTNAPAQGGPAGQSANNPVGGF